MYAVMIRNDAVLSAVQWGRGALLCAAPRRRRNAVEDICSGEGNARRASRRGEPRPAGRLPGASLCDAGKGPTGDTELRLRVIPVQEGNKALTPSGRALVPSPGAPPRQTLPQDDQTRHPRCRQGVMQSGTLLPAAPLWEPAARLPNELILYF